MKKIILAIAAIVAVFGANAQSPTDGAYVTLKGGASALLHPGCNGYENFGHSIQGQAGIQVGKWITPQVAFGLEATAGFDNGSKKGGFHGKNWLNHLDVLAISKFNLNNVFKGYRGVEDKVQVLPYVGIGWTHGWTYLGHSNDITTKYAVDVAFNVSEKFQINVTPFIAYNLTGGFYRGANNPRFDARNSWWGIEAGASYKFGNGFCKCQAYPQAEIDALNTEINELRSRHPETVYVEKPVEKVVEKVVVKKEYADVVISFRNNSSVLEARESAKLRGVPKDATIVVVGSATKFGNSERNDELSKQRAQVVADWLKNNGVKNVTTEPVGTKLNKRVAVVKITVAE